MTDPTAPTPEDLSRSLPADLELCERLDLNEPWHTADDGTGRVYDRYYKGILKPTQDNSHTHGYIGQWAAAARTGWPAALRRALAAEAESANWRERAFDAERQVEQLREAGHAI